MQQPQTKYTYSDYLLLDDDDRRELIEGDFYVAPAPNIWHQQIVASLASALRDHVRANRLGTILWAPTDVVLSQENVVQPDILFVSNDRRGIIAERNISGTPDLVVEVLSPGTAERDRQQKLDLYARFGVPEYWIVDPDERSVQVLELAGHIYERSEKYRAGAVASSVLPGLRIEIDQIFAGD